MLKRILIGLFRSHEFTEDQAADPQLKTHYYRLPRDRAFQEAVSILSSLPGYAVLHEIPNAGEIILEKRTAIGRIMDITVQIVSAPPNLTAVDIYSASRGVFGDLGANYRVIMELFKALDEKLNKYLVQNR